MSYHGLHIIIISDEPELEFSGSSRAEPSWGTLIFEQTDNADKCHVKKLQKILTLFFPKFL